MKTVNGSLSLIFRLSITFMALLIGQQALAAGTTADTQVLNRATVVYSVNAVPQTEIESSPLGNSTPGATQGQDTEFRVDRRVDFQIDQVQIALTPVDQGDADQVVEYLLTNNSNSALDFALTAINALDGADTGHGVDNDVDVANLRWHVSASPEPGGPDPVLGTDPVNVINLAADQSIRIWVYADIIGAFSNGDVAVIELSATAAEPNSAAATLLEESAGPGDPLVVENVWANGPVGPGVNFIETQLEGYEISTFPLTITKISTVISDPINGVSANAKAIPGAVIEYLITIDNSAAAVAATGISISDVINAPSVFRDATNPPPLNSEPYNGGTANVQFGPIAAPTGFCLADADVADGCTLAGTTLTIAGSTLGVLTPIDVAAGAVLEVRFQVIIPPIP